MINEVQARVSIGTFLGLRDLRNNASFRVMARLLTLTAISEQCVAKLVHGVLLLYLALH